MTTIYEFAVDHALRHIADELDALRHGIITASPEHAARIWEQIQALRLFQKLNQIESTALAMTPAHER